MFKRGDRVTTTGPNAETATIVHGVNITLGIGDTEHTERWLKVRFDTDGAALCVHPSNLAHLDIEPAVAAVAADLASAR